MFLCLISSARTPGRSSYSDDVPQMVCTNFSLISRHGGGERIQVPRRLYFCVEGTGRISLRGDASAPGQKYDESEGLLGHTRDMEKMERKNLRKAKVYVQGCTRKWGEMS